MFVKMVEHQNKDYFHLMGKGRLVSIIASVIALIGIIGGLALPLLKELNGLYLVLKIYYTIASAMIIFGLVSISKYHNVGIHIYFGFFTILALISSTVSAFTVYVITQKMKNEGAECRPLVDDCMNSRDYFMLGFNVLQILFFLTSWAFLLRFLIMFRKQFKVWEESYKNQGMDSNFHHWFDSSLKKSIDLEQH